MNDVSDTAVAETGRRLSDVVREVRTAAADRDDVVVDMREAQRMRLELLANELAPVFADVPEDNDWFDFVISSGLQPRLWIDAVCHVSMGRDRREYRFLRDTRLGRVVLAESTDMKTIADHVTRYVAERIVERQRIMEGDVARPATAGVAPVDATAGNTPAPETSSSPKVGRWRSFWLGLALVLIGGLVGLAAAMSGGMVWARLVEMGLMR